MELKPLRDCIKSIRESVRRDYDAASADKLFEIILDCDSKLLEESTDSPRVDALRSVIWFANAALTRKGIPPRLRTPLGPVPTTTTRLLHIVRKADAPYIDLQWLGHHRPDSLPTNWSGIRSLIATAPGTKALEAAPEDIILDPIDDTSLIDIAFDAADRLITRQDSIADKCRRLKLSPAAQIEHRWLCSRSAAQLLDDVKNKERDLRKLMHNQGIKQLTEELIEQRLLIFRAWKLSGGGTKWQAAAETYQSMTGRSITRQGIRDMITRMSEQKLIRLRRGRKKTAQPLLPAE